MNYYMKRAIKISLKPDVTKPSSCIDIDKIQIKYDDGLVLNLAKAYVHDMVKAGHVIIVDNPAVAHKPELIAVESVAGEKYVRSEPDDIESDNLLNLPRI